MIAPIQMTRGGNYPGGHANIQQKNQGWKNRPEIILFPNLLDSENVDMNKYSKTFVWHLCPA